MKLGCGCDLKPKGDKFDKNRRKEAPYTHCYKCVKKKFPHINMKISSNLRVVGRHVVVAAAIKMTAHNRGLANQGLTHRGLDGNGRFRSVSEAISVAFDVLAKVLSIESDGHIDAFFFKRPSGQRALEIAYTNHEDSFSPISITNSNLWITWHKMDNGRFEVIAYLT